ncbi:MAG: hypothetical protein WCR70_06925 [Sphaerochaetaceae bacterium]|jgi:hypothetical protein
MLMERAGYVSKTRNSAARKPKKVMLIIAEGKNCTETKYFSRIKSDSYSIHFAKGNDTDSVKMMRSLKRQYSELGLNPERGDIGICLVDSDCNPAKDSQIQEADSLATRAVK